MKKVTLICFISLSVLFGIFLSSNPSYAKNAESYLTLYSEYNDEIPLYEDLIDNKVLLFIPNEHIVQLLNDHDDEYIYVRYEYKNDESVSVVVEGYVNKEFILLDENDKNTPNKHEGNNEQTLNSSEDSFIDEQVDGSDFIDTPPIGEGTSDNEKSSSLVKQPLKDAVSGTNVTVLDQKTESSQMFSAKGVQKTMTLNAQSINQQTQVANTQSIQIEKYRGVAKKRTTNIRVGASTKSKILRQVPIGYVLNMEAYSSNWYKVNIGGQVGYIHRKHVTAVKTKPVDVRGVAKKKTTNIRVGASTKSKVLRKVPIGHVMSMKTFSKNWYEVTIGGQIGYIHRKHVTAVKTKPVDATLYALRSPTNVRVGASTKANVLTKIPRGTLLKLKTFSKNWYSYTATINGKRQTGYIHRKHVGIPKVIVIDAGHGGSDPGAIGNGLKEKDINLDIAKRVQKLLANSGYQIVMTRTNDTFIPLQGRSSLANNLNASLFVSIHTNAGGAQGIETYWYSKGPEATNSKILAEHIQSEMINETKTRDRGVKDANFHVNRETKMPSALVEVGFIDNKNDAAKLNSSSYKELVAKGIANGIKKFLKVFG